VPLGDSPGFAMTKPRLTPKRLT